MVKKKIEVLTKKDRVHNPAVKDAERRINKEIPGMSGKYSGR
ncbi:hypothetical protein N4T77_16045 [Clostridium sp. CX1]|uniref:Uncharacterized protein n=1 Tax=Clostridium tanneri TaxID=3037988 RepID=A0ABU4JSL6_9CLOT|nr:MULTISPECIES: hypothetical protein [unclassified Clostridium]MCT8978103.1 hypothetical protein [Clostridium sp. CX1]MDW8800954.1 hypothetical protein [Clostridium sp. A1-XYC3]